MNNIDEGGPAFPELERLKKEDSGGHFEAQTEGGMTLRDYFAAKAMQGICAHADTWGLQQAGIVASAYLLADAMLAERSK